MKFRSKAFLVLMFSIASGYRCWAAPLHLTTPADVTARFHNDQGISFARKGENERALAEFEKALALSPDFVRAFFNRGLVYMRMRHYDQAIVEFGKVIEIGNKNAGAQKIREATYVPKKLYAQVYFNRGTAHLNRAVYDLAIADFTTALRIDPKLSRALNNRGAAQLEKRQFDQALSDFESALKLNPKYALAFMNRGLLYYRKGENDLAIRDYNEAIRLDPKLALAYANRGRAYAKNARFDLALADFNMALQRDPDNAGAYDGLATLYARQGKYAEAEPLFKRALTFFEKTFGPQHPHVAEVLEHYGSMLRKIGRESEAAAMAAHSKAIRDIYKHN